MGVVDVGRDSCCGRCPGEVATDTASVAVEKLNPGFSLTCSTGKFSRSPFFTSVAACYYRGEGGARWGQGGLYSMILHAIVI